MAIHLPPENATLEEILEVNGLIFLHIYSECFYCGTVKENMYGICGGCARFPNASNIPVNIPNYFTDETAAFAFLSWWLRKQYQAESEFGNFLTIRDARRGIKGSKFKYTRWRVSLYYRTNPQSPSRWYTMTHRLLATSITYSILKCLTAQNEPSNKPKHIKIKGVKYAK